MNAPLDWLPRFPELMQLEAPAQSILARARELSFATGQLAFRPGDPCEGYILVLEGSVRVSQLSDRGREIVLYRVEEGQACILTTACLMAHRSYANEGVAETDVRAAFLPGADFFELLQISDRFRSFVFASFGERLVDLMALIDNLAFHRIEERLAHVLVECCDENLRVHETHKLLADEIGSAREVVSRRLKDFERRGLLAISRGEIRILDLTGLRALYRPAAR